MKRLITSTAVLALVAAATAYASNVHLKPPNANPTFTDQGLTLNVTGGLAGLGTGDVLVDMTAQANATAVCTNPSGQNKPPGQNPAPVTVSGQEVIPGTEVKNGNATFNVTTLAPTTPIAGAPGCPNSSWTETITDLSFTSADITIHQPATSSPSTTVLEPTCGFTPSTVNGLVPSGDVAC